ncbi:DHH family phosphoesterase [Leifsonia sp. C5G2]|uniref:DHH family phosphoesterase n=1 Tax=Leifsonia sp. C5G2 TaxID=2735269 RepID=UPI0015851A06|nr:DHH family phosphoesterase [Leifsonia sp. C5G2]NUU07682.1 hypothetical protein [Leifsonia sp. C5G2]
MTTIVTSYVNPDLDGVASAILVAGYLMPAASLRFAGRLNAETLGVLGALRLQSDLGDFLQPVTNPANFVLVDCHHPAQLPSFVRPEDVIQVIDHHPDGHPEAFPNAVVQNEKVGAATTLVVEHVLLRPASPLPAISAHHAGLVACAIASNTLDFTAPSTSARDMKVFGLVRRLAQGIELDPLLASMREWRAQILSASTREAVEHDVKVIDSSLGKVAVAQIEAHGARVLIHRPELRQELEALASSRGAISALLSLVDTEEGTTTLFVTNSEVGKLVAALHPSSQSEFVFKLPYIALRKTHVIPALQG